MEIEYVLCEMQELGKTETKDIQDKVVTFCDVRYFLSKGCPYSNYGKINGISFNLDGDKTTICETNCMIRKDQKGELARIVLSNSEINP